MIFKNKKAGEKILSPWMFLIWMIIILGIAIGAVIFYGVIFEVKTEEARIMNFKLMDCIVQDAYVRSDFFKSDFDIFKECNLHKETIETSGVFYFSINITNSSGNQIRYASAGNPDLITQWRIKKEEKQLASGFLDNVTALYINDAGVKEEVNVRIITASNNMGARI